MKKKAEAAAAPGSRKITTCLYNYVPEQEGELPLVRGKLVTILAMEGNWWRGECQGEVKGLRALQREWCWAHLFSAVGAVPAVLCAQPR